MLMLFCVHRKICLQRAKYFVVILNEKTAIPEGDMVDISGEIKLNGVEVMVTGGELMLTVGVEVRLSCGEVRSSGGEVM